MPRVDDRQDGARDQVPILVQRDRHHRLKIRRVAEAVVVDAAAKIQIVLERHVDQRRHGSREFSGETGRRRLREAGTGQRRDGVGAQAGAPARGPVSVPAFAKACFVEPSGGAPPLPSLRRRPQANAVDAAARRPFPAISHAGKARVSSWPPPRRPPYCMPLLRNSSTTFDMSKDVPPCTGGYSASVMRCCCISTLIGWISHDTFCMR